jgi:hypothetical protein
MRKFEMLDMLSIAMKCNTFLNGGSVARNSTNKLEVGSKKEKNLTEQIQ